MMKTKFRFDFDQDKSGGILMYEVRKERNVKSNRQSSIGTIRAKATEHTSKMARLLVTWRINHLGELKVRTVLVEHDKELTLDEDELAQLYDKINDILFDYSIEDRSSDYCSRDHSFFGSSRHTWLMCDNTVLEATYEIVNEEGLELVIVISKGAENWCTRPALWIDSER
jgi:hypothetical protein